MSTEHSRHQNGIGRIDDDEQPASREELALRLRLEELKRTQLRRRLATLEEKVDVEPDDVSDKMAAMENDLIEALDELEADNE